MLFLIHKNIGTLLPFLKVLGILNSNVWFGTGAHLFKPDAPLPPPPQKKKKITIWCYKVLQKLLATK